MPKALIAAAAAITLSLFNPANADDIPQPRACTLTCPANITKNTDPGRCGAVVFFSLPTSTGTCTIVQTAGLPSGSEFPTGTTTNAFGDQATGASCTFKIIVKDAEPPVLTCPSPDSVVARVGSDCMAEVPDFKNLITGSDNCDGNIVIFDSQTPLAGTKVNPGSTPVTIKARDGSGNTTTCIYSLNVDKGCGCGMCGVGTPMMLNAVGFSLLLAKRRRW